MTDQQALEDYAGTRSAEAFGVLVQEYQRLVYAAASRRLARVEDIEDVVQTTFLKLARKAGTIRQNLSMWLYSTAVNTANDLIRRDQTRRRHEAMAIPAEASEHDAEQREWRALSLVVDEALLELPDAQRTLIVEHFLRGRTQRDLAEEMGVSQPTIKRRIDAAIEDLRAKLEKRGYSAAGASMAGIMTQMPQPPVPAPLTSGLMKIGLTGVSGAVSAVPIAFTGIWKIAAVAAGFAIVSGVILLRSPTAAQRVPTPPPASTLPIAEKPDPADWRAQFDQTYALLPSQNLKFIPPPPLALRQQYFKEVEHNDTPMPFIQWRWTDGRLQRQAMQGSGPAGASLASVITTCTTLRWEQVSASGVPAINCNGDWIVRDGASTEAVLADLRTILHDQLKTDLKFEKQEEMKDALVVSGQYRMQRLPEATDNHLQVFADVMDHPKPGDSIMGGGNTPPAQFWTILGSYLRIPMVDEAAGEPARISWLLSRSLTKANTEEGRRQILDNLTQQTGLTFKQEPRTFVTWTLLPATAP
jgi:RNA polymerase sigma factor (sigma-70 family)